MADTSAKEKTLDVAIIGGGIAGLTLALGLSSRNVNVRIYERGHSFREIGAGIGFTPNAEWAMRVLDPRIHAAFKRVAAQNANDWFRWVNGYSQNGAEDGVDGIHEDLIYKMYLGERGFEGCHRADFLDELVKMMPEGGVEFSKNLHSIDDRGDGEKLRLNFRDGSSEEADAGIEGPDSFPSQKCQSRLTFQTLPSHRLRWHQISRPPARPRRRQTSILPQIHAQIRLPRPHPHGTSPSRFGRRKDPNSPHAPRS